jgi:uncharacterized protein with FMN-binding domain
MEPGNSDKNKQIIATLVVLVMVVLVVIGTKAFGSKDDVATVSSNVPQTNTSGSITSSESTSDSATDTNESYKDGTYNATGTYTSPGGSQAIEVSVTVASGTVTATSAVEKASDSESQEFQADFISGYKSLVVGKSLNSISLSRVSGSSLTSQGFNNALEQIKDQAKV